MNDAPAILRSLITFALIVALAMDVGYTLTHPLDYSTLAILGVLLMALLFLLLMHWHNSLMLSCWNMSASHFCEGNARGVNTSGSWIANS